MTPIHYKNIQALGRHPHGTCDVQIYGEVVQERTTDHGHNQVYQHDAKGLRHQRSRHPGVNRKQHRLHQ
jgi:hypothetical protein